MISLRATFALGIVCTAPAYAVSLTLAPQVTVSGRQVTFWWKTDVSSSTELGWGPASTADFTSYPNHSAFAALAGLKHSRTLRRLPPGTYFYRVRSGAGSAFVESSEGSFVVPDAETFPLGEVSVPNGSSVVRVANTWYVGATAAHVARVSGSFALTDPSTGALVDTDFPEISGRVVVITPDGAGGYYLGGLLASAGGVACSNAIHLLPDHGIDLDWKPQLDESVSSISVGAQAVYLGGFFSTVNGSSRVKLAAVDKDTASLTAWNARFDPSGAASVSAVIASGSAVLVAGSFSTMSSTPRSNLAAVDPTTGALLSWAPNPNGVINAMAVDGTLVYVGGGFSTIAGGTRAGAAAIGLTDGLLAPWDPALTSVSAPVIKSLAIAAGTVYFAGSFTAVNGAAVARAAVAAVDTTPSATATSWAPVISGSVDRLTVGNGVVYLSGASLFQVNATPRRAVAAVDANSGALLPWSPTDPTRIIVVHPSSALLAVGGDQLSADPIAHRGGAVALDALTGALLPWNPGLSGSVDALATSGSTLFVGGTFSSADGGVTRLNAASFSTVTGALTTWNPQPNSRVVAIAVAGTTVYLGGQFTTVNGGVARKGLAAVDATTGAVLPWNPELGTANVSALVVSGSTVYLAGSFASVNNGVSRAGLAAVDAVTGVVTTWDPELSRSPFPPAVFALAASPTTLYVTGLFTHAKGSLRVGAAAFSTSTGALESWDPFPNNGLGARSLGLAGDVIFLGGNFSAINGTLPRSGVSAVDAVTGVARPFAPTMDQFVFGLGVDCASRTLAAVGNFSTWGLAPRGGVALVPLPEGCSEVDAGPLDGGTPDAGAHDAGGTLPGLDGGADAGATDAGSGDAGSLDAGSDDAGAAVTDAGEPDAGLPVDDAGALDAGSDAGELADAGRADAGEHDAGVPDAGINPTEPNDAGVAPDGGSTRPATPDAAVADAGSDPAPSVGGCGCTSVAAQTFVLPLLALLARRRSRRRGAH